MDAERRALGEEEAEAYQENLVDALTEAGYNGRLTGTQPPSEVKYLLQEDSETDFRFGAHDRSDIHELDDSRFAVFDDDAEVVVREAELSDLVDSAVTPPEEKPDIELTDLLDAEIVDGEIFSSFKSTPTSTSFTNRVMDILYEAETLIEHYSPVEISTETGLPVFRTSDTQRRGYRHLRRDKEQMEDNLNELRHDLLSYVRSRPWKDDVDLESREVSGKDNLFTALKHDLVATSKPDLATGTLPRKQNEQALELDKLQAVDSTKTLSKGDVGLATKSRAKGIVFNLNVADYSTTKDDSPLYYRITGMQEAIESGWFSGEPPIEGDEEEGYSVGDELHRLLAPTQAGSLFEWGSEKVLEDLDNLEQRDIEHGDRFHVGQVESIRVGPFYFKGMREPPTAEEGMDMMDAVSEDELKQRPDIYIATRLRECLDDNPEQYIFTVENQKATKNLAGDVEVERELTYIAPEESRLEDYLPDEPLEDENGTTTVNVVYTDEFEAFNYEDIEIDETDTTEQYEQVEA